MTLSSRTIGLAVIFCIACASATLAGSAAQTQERNPATLVTLVLHQKKGQSLVAFKEQIEENGFREAFPPEGVEVVSWTGALGLGHVITLRLPTYKIPDVRAVVEGRKWGEIKPKLYSSYDFQPFWQDMGGDNNSVSRSSRDSGQYAVESNRMLIAP